MNKIKIVSDFDGIWTDQKDEAGYVWNYIVNAVSDIADISLKEASEFLDECRTEMNKHPENYGWKWGRLTAAFYHEDPYGDNNAIFDFIANAVIAGSLGERIKKVRDVLNERYNKKIPDFSQECFTISTGKYKSEGKLRAVDNAAGIVKELTDLNCEIVVASNSSTDKIKYLFTKAGVKISGDPLGKRSAVHARGDASKFKLFESDWTIEESLDISENIKVPLRRSSYFNILLEEKPDFVIGDVFSLDIALPLYLRMNDPRFKNLKVVQRLQEYTPQWVRDHLVRNEYKGIAFTVEHVKELPSVIKKNI